MQVQAGRRFLNLRITPAFWSKSTFMNIKTNTITVKRRLNKIGWIGQLNFIDLETEKPLKLKYYNGRLCFQILGKRTGYKTFQQKSVHCNLIIDNSCPF
jgi:hypothetical protein